MKRRLLVSLLLAICALSGQTPAHRRALVHESEDWIPGPPLDHVPEWNGSLLVGCDQCQSWGPILFTVDRQGRRDEVVFELPGSGFVNVDGMSSGPDGALAVVGYALSDDSRIARFIAWISPDRKRQIVTRVGPFRPYKVTVAPDGTIWTVGPVKAGDTTDDLYPNVLRHYEPSGRLLATATVKARPFLASAEVAAGSNLLASSDRIGWLTYGCEYIEFSFSAMEMGRYNCPLGAVNSFDVDGIGLSAEDDVVVGGRPKPPFAPLELNRITRTWDPVPVPADAARSWHRVIGFDGLSLVTLSGGDKLRRFIWGEPPPALAH
jgi:hypothetical protein